MKTKVESFDDIVFENRNQEYGAYELRKKYSKRGTIALAISLFLLFFAVGGPLIASMMKNHVYRNYIENNTIATIEKVKTEIDKIAPPPPPPTPVDVKQIAFVAPIIVDTLTNEEIQLATAGDLWQTGNSKLDDTTSIPVGDKILIVDDPEIEKIVEVFELNEKPVFPDGDAGLIKYIAEHTKYPVPALEGGIEGTVYIRFVVTKTGNIGDAKIMRGADPLLDDEALRVVKTLPKWIPGKINGTPVNVWFIIPVKFKLQ